MSEPHKAPVVGDFVHITRDTMAPGVCPAWGVVTDAGHNDGTMMVDLFISADNELEDNWPVYDTDTWEIVADEDLPDEVLRAYTMWKLNKGNRDD